MSERTYTESEVAAERAALLREIDVELAVAYEEANLLRCNEELAGNVVKHAHATGTMNGLNVARTVVAAIPTDQSALARRDEEREARFAAMFQEMFSVIDSCKDVPQQLIDAFEKIAAKGGGAIARVEAAARQKELIHIAKILQNRGSVWLAEYLRMELATLQDRGREAEK